MEVLLTLSINDDCWVITESENTFVQKEFLEETSWEWAAIETELNEFLKNFLVWNVEKNPKY